MFTVATNKLVLIGGVVINVTDIQLVTPRGDGTSTILFKNAETMYSVPLSVDEVWAAIEKPNPGGEGK